MSLLIRLARLQDLASVLALRHEAERWLATRGITQWINGADDQLADTIEAGHTWVVDHGGAVVATVTLGGADPDFWAPEDHPADGLYFYKLIVARSHAGAALGESVIDWAGRRAELTGRTWLRCDCWRDNYELHAYYLRAGFEHVRTVYQPHRRSGALFQRRSSHRTCNGPDIHESPTSTGEQQTCVS